MPPFRHWLAFASVLMISCQKMAATPGIQGAWHPQVYKLKDGSERRVTGLIFFTEKEWGVLFFVLDDKQQPTRASAEGGTYTVNGSNLVFTQLYHFSGGEPVGTVQVSPLRIEIHSASEAGTEACTIEIEDDHLTIFFPSGNAMTFTRSSGLRG